MVNLLDEDETRAKIHERLNSHEWWLLIPMDRMDVLIDIEQSFYSGDANADFEVFMGSQLPGFGIALAKKCRMSPGMLAGKLGIPDISLFHERDVIQFGPPGRAEWDINQFLRFAEWLGVT